MVDDPDFTELVNTEHDLIELRIVGNRIGVHPVATKSRTAARSSSTAPPARPPVGTIGVIVGTVGLIWLVGGLAARIGAALDDPDARARIGAAGRERVIDRWSWRHTAEATVEQYRALLDEWPAARPPQAPRIGL